MPNLHVLATSCVRLELRSLPSTGVTRLQRYYEPLRHPRAPGLSVTGLRLVVPDHALGLPVLPALSLCTCCRHYPGAATGFVASLIHPVVSAFPGMAAGSAYASTFSRLVCFLRWSRLLCDRWCFRLPSATVKRPGWRGLWLHLPSVQGQTPEELPHPHRQASMRNLAADDRRFDRKLTPVCPTPASNI